MPKIERLVAFQDVVELVVRAVGVDDDVRVVAGVPSLATTWANTSAFERSTASMPDLLPNQATCTLLKRMASITPA